MNIEEVMALAPVIPVLVVDDAAYARPIAEALVAGGLRALEITLRTEAALKVIREMAKVDGAVVGAGTVLNRDDMNRALDAGARFIVSPGLTEPLGAICCSCAQLAGDSDLAVVYGKEELARNNPNPVKRFHALRQFGTIQEQEENIE